MQPEKKTITYPYLPKGQTISYVPLTDGHIREAREQAKKSNDHSMPTGAVIVSDGKVIAGVSNKTPLSSPALIALHKKYCIRRMLHVPSGQKYWLCPGCASHANHAEYRAVLGAQKTLPEGHPAMDLYLWGHWWCCQPCWDKMLELPIRQVYLLEGSEVLFNIKDPDNIVGHQFEKA